MRTAAFRRWSAQRTLLVPEFGQVVFLKAEMMSDLVQQRYADLALKLLPVAGKFEDPIAKQVNGLRQLGAMLDRSLGERRTAVQAAEKIVRAEVQLTQQLRRRPILDDHRRLLQQRLESRGHSAMQNPPILRLVGAFVSLAGAALLLLPGRTLAQCSDPAVPQGGFALTRVLDQAVTYGDTARTLMDVRYPSAKPRSCGFPVSRRHPAAP